MTAKWVRQEALPCQWYGRLRFTTRCPERSVWEAEVKTEGSVGAIGSLVYRVRRITGVWHAERSGYHKSSTRMQFTVHRRLELAMEECLNDLRG